MPSKKRGLKQANDQTESPGRQTRTGPGEQLGCRAADDTAFGVKAALDWCGPDRAVSSSEPALEIVGLDHVLRRRIGWGEVSEFKLRIKKLVIPRGSFCCITGQNGCGKTTLLTIMGLLQKPTQVKRFILRSGRKTEYRTYPVGDLWKSYAGRRRIQDLRRSELGFVLQSGGLLESLSAFENIELALRANGCSRKESRERIAELCSRLGLNDKQIRSIPKNLSGGQQQVTALARSVAHFPGLILVDEPTASLHTKLARQTLTLLKQMQDERGSELTVIMVTHDQDLAREFGTFQVFMEADLDRNRGSIERVEG